MWPDSVESACRLGFILVSFGFLAHRLYLWRRSTFGKQVSAAATPVRSNKDRADGEWYPESFTYPPVKPRDKDLKDIRPIPYRPFRWGQYHVTMAIRNMSWDDWIELDQRFPEYHKIRDYRIKTRGELVCRILPPTPGVVRGGQDAAKELVYELAEYLSRRYPSTFTVKRHPVGGKADQGYGWYGQGQIKDITIVPVNATYNLDEENPMKISALLVQDDLALMLEGADGRYYFQAGAICLPGFWRMQDKIGLPLDEIHFQGHVPQYKEKLHTSMARFFKRMPADKPVIRNNYFIQVIKDPFVDRDTVLDPEELAWSTTTNGDEDAFLHGVHGAYQETGAASKPRNNVDLTDGGKSEVTPAHIRFRTERQTLRRLPKSGAVLFTVRTYLVPMEELAKEKGVPGRMASAVRSWPEDVASYKGQRAYADVLLPFLDEQHRLQVERGEVAEDDREANYPF